MVQIKLQHHVEANMSERPVKGDVPDEEPIPENLHNQEDKKADADQAKANPDSTSKQGYKQL